MASVLLSVVREVRVKLLFATSVTAVTLMVAGITMHGREVVDLRLHGRYFVEPATVRVLVTVEPDADNRILRVEADGLEMFRSTDVTLDGSAERRLHTIEFKNLVAGEYVIRARVLSANAVRGTVAREMVVTGGGR